MSITPCREPWPGTMTHRERFARQMRFQSVDRSVNREFGYWDENFTQWPLFLENEVRNNDEADRFFNFDPTPAAGANNWLHPGFKAHTVEVRGDRRIVQNTDGLLAEVPVDDHATIPHFLKSSVTTPDDWQRVKEEHLRLDDPARVPDIDAILDRHPEDRDYALSVWTGSLIGKIRDMLTMEGLAYACYDYPDMVEDMVETACLLVEQGLDRLLPHISFDYATGWEDICFRSGPLVTMDFARTVLAPRYKRIGDRLRAHGIEIWFTDCDGDVRPLIPIFLEAGMNTLFPFEVMASGHPGETLDRYPGEIRIMGGFDKMQMVDGREAIRAYMDSLVPYVERGGFIPFCDHRCPPDVDPNDYLYYLDLKQQMFGLKA